MWLSAFLLTILPIKYHQSLIVKARIGISIQRENHLRVAVG